jgi:hypothetical protein
MSWYNTIVLSFSSDEFEDEEDESCHDCAALRNINVWLKRQRYARLADLNPYKGGKLGSNAVLFGGCYNHLDVEPFLECVGQQNWKHPNDVQVLFWDDNASKCSLIGFTLKRSGGRKNAKGKKPGANSRKRRRH